MSDPGPARTQAFAYYIAFRHADRARQRGHLSQAGYDAAAKALGAQVRDVWQKIFPDEGPAYAWVLERLKMFDAEQVISADAAAKIRALATPKAGGDPHKGFGALALLWRVHVFYQLVSELADQGSLPPNALARIKEAMHSLALAALNRETKNAGPRGGEVLLDVVQAARLAVRTLCDNGTLSPVDGAALMASLGGLSATGTPGGPEPVRAPAKLNTDAGSCLVCGDGLEARQVVYCGSCETPHHPDCWSYNGRCAMFACGCLEATPRPGGSPAPRFDLDRPAPPARPRPAHAHAGPNMGQALSIVGILVGLVVLSAFASLFK